MTNKTYFQVKNLFKISEEDVYQDGCIAGSGRATEIDISFSGNTPDEVIEKVSSFLGMKKDDDGIEKNACDVDGRVDFQKMENSDGETPSLREIENWKKGSCRLWLVFYSARVEMVTSVKI